MLLSLGYIIKSGILLTTLYVYYMLVLRKQTLFATNRFYLLVTLLLATILPFLHINFQESVPTEDTPIILPAVLTYVNTVSNYSPEVVSEEPFFNLGVIYLIGVVAFTLRYIWSIGQVFRLRLKYPGKRIKGLRLILLPENYGTFSFFSYIFLNINNLSREQQKNIFEHEKIHIRQMHSLDLVITEILCILNWFNPFIWLMKSAILQNHEYIADQQVIRRFQTGSYLLLLVNQTFKRAFSFTNYFHCSNLKKRMIMMTKQQTQKYRIINLLPAIAIAGILFCGFSYDTTAESSAIFPASSEDEAGFITTAQKDTFHFTLGQDSIPKVNLVADEMPVFLAGNLITWINKNIKYPAEAIEKGIQGKVYVQFIIDEEGNVTNPKILRGVDLLLDNEAIRVVNAMPKWKPGKSKGKPVSVLYTSPIKFSLGEKPQVTPQAKETPAPAIDMPDEMPVFPEGNLAKWIAKNTKYPASAIENKIQGKVYVQFNIEKDGSISDIKILKGVHPDLDQEAMRVISTMPKWKPGVQRNAPVRVPYTLPVNFSLGISNPVEKLDVKNTNAVAGADATFIVVESMPQFPEGKVQSWIAKNVKYPSSAFKDKIQGKVYVQFIIEKDGTISNAKVVKGSHPALNQEAVRVINSMPKWIPGTQKGQPVRVSYTIPIRFALS